MAPDPSEKVLLWRAWLLDDVRPSVVGLYFRRHVWREIGAIMEANPSVGELRSAYWDYWQETYTAAQAIAVRRLADRTRGSRSLRKLLEALAASPTLLTRDIYLGLLDEKQAAQELMVERSNREFDRWADETGEHLNRAMIRSDIERLEEDSKLVEVYVNENLAHSPAQRKLKELPTYADLHAAIDAVGPMFQKYAVILTGEAYVLEPVVIEGDWKAIFRQQWIREE